MIPESAEKYIYYQADGISLYLGECLDVMRSMPDSSVDSIVTDPPYGISFMGKKWDYKVPSVEEWAEALRVLKPGGHMLAFGGSRTYHRVVVNIEDAGFEIRDQIMWIYGSGFPKSLDVSKAIDKAAGAEREIGPTVGEINGRDIKNHKKKHDIFSKVNGWDKQTTAPATPEAKQWDGWGTALKPAHEPICVARKPLIGTVAENVLEHGTGGININGCRIEHCEPVKVTKRKGRETASVMSDKQCGFDNTKDNLASANSKGRFPANLILDSEAGAMLDRQSGTLQSGDNCIRTKEGHFGEHGGLGKEGDVQQTYGDSGGASRFFYCPKASKFDRDEGLEGMELGPAPGSKRSKPAEGRENALGNPRANFHPTVKPTALMQYLVRLVTPPGGTVLDPFMGSGSTGKACVREGFRFIGIDRDKEYLPIAKARIKAPAQVTLI